MIQKIGLVKITWMDSYCARVVRNVFLDTMNYVVVNVDSGFSSVTEKLAVV